MIRVFTGRYSNPNVPETGLVPVGITRYPPRFRLAYELKANLYDLAPTHAMLAAWKTDRALDAFVAEYEQRLAQIGFVDIVRQLSAMQGGSEGVILLCYEDLTAGEVCHRRTLADWLSRNTGIQVPELPDPGRSNARKKPRDHRG